MLKSIRSRLVLTYLLLVLISLGVATFFFLRWTQVAMVREARSQLEAQSRILAHVLMMYTTHEEDLPDNALLVMKRFPDLTPRGGRVRIADRHSVLGDSRAGEDFQPGSEPLEEQALAALEGAEVVHYSTVEAGVPTLHAAHPIRLEYPEARNIGVVVVSSALTEVQEAYVQVRSRLLTALAIALAASCLVALLLARTLSRPILRIRRAASRIAEGDLEERVEVGGAVELAALGATINHMAAQLSQRLGELVSERNKMTTLLASLPDPVVALDAAGCVSYLNPAGEAALGCQREHLEGKPLPEEWRTQLRGLLSGEAPAAREIRTGERVYRAFAVPFRDEAGEPGRLLVLRDVTDLRRLEEMRNLFLGSVSHELRTPLTVIKGFVVTLLDGAEGEVRKALSRIDREADRLTRLVGDLIELSRLSTRRLSLELQPTLPEEIVRDTVEMLSAAASRQGLALELELEEHPRPLPLDPDRFRQVLLNLVDNACKFTPAGGRVTVRTAMDSDSWRLEVADTGPGIPPEELPHLFEHFFRSKVPRLRKVRGTGLGLAIVKEIVEMHRGRVEADSRPGRGTTIRVTFPARPEVRGEG